jgi:hypothetical protein
LSIFEVSGWDNSSSFTQSNFSQAEEGRSRQALDSGNKQGSSGGSGAEVHYEQRVRAGAAVVYGCNMSKHAGKEGPGPCREFCAESMQPREALHSHNFFKRV